MDLLGAPGASKLRCWSALGLQNGLLALQVDVLERFGPPCWGSGRALGVQIDGLGVPWASKLRSLGSSGPPSWGPWEALGSQMAPKESFGPPKSVAKRLRMHFCNVMQNQQKPKANHCFCMVFPMLRGLQKALGPPS